MAVLTAPASTPSFARTPRTVRWRNWMFQVHLWVGLVLGLLVGIVCLTGAIVVFRYELNRLTVPGTAYVAEQAERLSIDELTRRIQADRPGDRLVQANFDGGPGTAWNFRTQSPDGHRIHTFINQYTGEITGQENYQYKLLQWIFDLHAYLLAGDTGMLLNGFVGLAAVVLSLTGLIVWWPGAARWRFGFRYLWGARWPRQNYDMHKVVGFYLSLIVAFVSVTGAYFSFPNLYARWTTRLTGTEVWNAAPRAATTWADRALPIEGFIEAAEAAQPGTRFVSLRFPQQPGDPVTVRTKEPDDWHRVGLNYVYLEPADARIVRNQRFATSPVGTQIIQLMYPLHFGRFGGRWGTMPFYGVMVAYVLIGAAPFVLMVTGLLMYWNRSFSTKWRRWRATAPARAAPSRAPAARMAPD
jgi:uncharacterized iron-regulated membrane protein